MPPPADRKHRVARTHPFQRLQRASHSADEHVESLNLLQQNHGGGGNVQAVILSDFVQVEHRRQLGKDVAGNLNTDAHIHNR